MDWEAEGLLDDLPDDGARKARAQLLDELEADGVPSEELRLAVEEQRLALLPLDRILGGKARFTARDVAEESGLPLDSLLATRRALGLPTPGPDEAAFDDDDVEAAKIGVTVRETGFDEDHVLETNRVLGRGMARFAEALRSISAELLLEPGMDERELAHRFAGLGETMLPVTREWVQHVFVMHFRQMLRNEAVTLQERTTGRADARQQAIAFADIVGFTALGETVGVEELGDVAARLARLAGDTVEAPVRVVKTIGDAVMIVAPKPLQLVAATLDLVEAAQRDEDFPPLRAGVAYGRAVNQYGDWFGSTVNLASRLTTRARPESVLVTGEVREAAGDEDGLKWSDAGPKRLKGFSDPVKTFRVRRADPARDGDG